jgi:hypothetical protein
MRGRGRERARSIQGLGGSVPRGVRGGARLPVCAGPRLDRDGTVAWLTGSCCFLDPATGFFFCLVSERVPVRACSSI